MQQIAVVATSSGNDEHPANIICAVLVGKQRIPNYTVTHLFKQINNGSNLGVDLMGEADSG